MIHEELSGKIIGAGMDVLNELRPGLDEKLYERAMIIELKRRGHSLDPKSISRFLSQRINWQPHS